MEHHAHTMKRDTYIKSIVVLLFFAVGLFLRLFQLDQLPSELHRDELGIGYNAYLILNTGFDEHQVGPYPLIFKSFGDYKLPLMIYLVAISEYFLDLVPFAVRLPTALAGALLVPLTYAFVTELFNKRPYSTKVAIIATAITATTTWSVFLSRTAYEPILGLTLGVAALTALLKSRRNPKWFGATVAAYALASFAYNLPFLLSVFMVPTTILFFRKEYFAPKQKSKTVVFLVLFALLWLILSVFFMQLTEQKSEATILNYQQLLADRQKWSDQLFVIGLNPTLRTIFTHEYVIIATTFLKNYSASFNPSYLFFTGGTNPWHSLDIIHIGNSNPAQLLFLVFASLGLVYTASRKRSIDIELFFLLAYIFLSPIPSALTIDAPVTNRLLDFHYAFGILGAYGLYWSYYELPVTIKPYSKLIAMMSVGAYLFFFGQFSIFYYLLHTPNLHPEWQIGVRDVLEHVRTVQHKYDVIYFNPENFEHHPHVTAAYIYLAFFTQIQPNEFHQTATWGTGPGLLEATHVGKYRVKKMNNSNDIAEDLSQSARSSFSKKTEGPVSILYITKDTIENIEGGSENIIYSNKVSENAPRWAVYEYQYSVETD